MYIFSVLRADSFTSNILSAHSISSGARKNSSNAFLLSSMLMDIQQYLYLPHVVVGGVFQVHDFVDEDVEFLSLEFQHE